ncbi:SH3 and multiple ankyrin repeat domains protein 3 isoform X3 [Neocloeon triangulifer]|uniref:SH3 and multiple ankyrin repeat domains protein 3 isoform X3 n=1 Tax=Neocloeon triangulifer TaxID=2078957 RepID=UPI00286FA624|nr:SH3 and multiple ankyrin repeat domains protein 3 isoform X3 [Neocloeon triangulifer]
MASSMPVSEATNEAVTTGPRGGDEQPAPQDPSEEGGVGGGSVLIRIHVPELNINKCLQFAREELIWNVKQQCLAALPKELKESFNYGLFVPPANGKAGKFLDEERHLTDYPFSGPVGYLELKYKRRVYKMLHLDEKQLKALHTRTNLRRLLDYVTNRQVEKISKMCSKGLDPNFHCAETGETPLTVAAATPRSSRVLLALVNGGALLDYRTRDGTTSMHRAVEKNNFEAIKTLLDLGASPNYKDSKGLTPLYLSMNPNVDPMLCEALLHDHAVVGAQDAQGWQEVHQACRHGLVQHLEHLLFYGADMNARNASGNTPLHVCAVNGQDSCSRLLLFRGADREALNYANQTPYQVAVIAGNLELAETIQKHRPEEAVPFREPPRYNPKRRPASAIFLPRSGSVLDFQSALPSSASCLTLTSSTQRSLPPSSMSSHALLCAASTPPPPPSPSPSDRSNPPCFSSGCSSLSEASSNRGSEGSSEDPASIVTDKSLLDQCDIISDSSGVGTSNSGGSGGGYDTGAGLLLAGVTAVCVENYSSNTPGHLCLTQGDIVEVTGATDCGLLEGTCRGRSGLFAAHCVQEVRMRQNVNSATLRVGGRRENKMNHFATAPRSKKPITIRLPSEPRTVVLHRSRKGFGFVLRGAKATSPLMELTPSERCPALQYLDDVDAGGVADVAGLKKGDYLLEINGEDVTQASHEHVVELIRRSGDLVAMKVVSLGEPGVATGMKAATTLPSRQCATLPRKLNAQNRNPAPLPPRRDPKTTLSVGRARARSLVADLDGNQQQNSSQLDEADSEDVTLSANTTKSSSTESVQARGTPPRTASIRARPTSSRITAAELEELFARQGPAPPSPAGSARTPKVYASVAEMKRSRGKLGRRGASDTLHKSFSSTPDLAHVSPTHAGARMWSSRGARSQEDISWWVQPTQTSGHIGTTAMTNGGREYGHAWRSMERLHMEHEAVTRSLSQRTRSLPRNRSLAGAAPPPPTHPPPPIPVGQVVRVEVSPRTKSSSEYATVRDSPVGQQADSRTATPTSPEPIMSSFRPGPAKLYASPEEVKVVALRQGSSTLGRTPKEGAKSRSHSLPPSGARPLVRKHSQGEGSTTFKPPADGAPASPEKGSGATSPYAQPFQHNNAAAVAPPVAAPPIPEPDYSMSEGESDEGGSEAGKGPKKERRPSRQSSKDSNTAESISPNGPLSPSARSSCMSPVFKDLLAQKVAERQTRVNGAGTPAEETPPPPPPHAKQPETPSTPVAEAAPPAAPSASNSSSSAAATNGNLPHSFSVEEIQKVKTQLKSSKSYPNDFSQEDGDNSSSGVSSDQDTQPEPKTAGDTTHPPKSSSPHSKSQQTRPIHTTRIQVGAPAFVRSSSVINSGRAPGQKGPAAMALNVNGKMPAPPEKKPAPPQQAQKDEIKHILEERTWQPDGSESTDAPDAVTTQKPRRKSEDGAGTARRAGTGTLTRHAVSLVQLPPPQESEGESDHSLPPAIRHSNVNSATLPHKTTKTVTFLDHKIQEERDRERQREIERERELRQMQMRDGPIMASKLIMPNHRQQPLSTAHMGSMGRHGGQRSREVDAMGRPIEMERSIEESLQLIQRHVEQLNMVSVVPPPPEFDGARAAAAAAAAAAHAHHYHPHQATHPPHQHQHQGVMHASYPSPHQQAAAAAAGRAHHPHLYHLHPAPDEPVLVAPPPEFSDLGEQHKMTIRVSGATRNTLQRMTPEQQAQYLRQRQLEEMARHRHLEDLNRQRQEAIRMQQQQQQQQKTVRIVGTLPKKAP